MFKLGSRRYFLDSLHGQTFNESVHMNTKRGKKILKFGEDYKPKHLSPESKHLRRFLDIDL